MDAEFWCGEKKVLGRWVKWKPATMQEAAEAYEKVGVQGVACFAISNRRTEWWER